MPGETERIAKTRIERIGPERLVGSEAGRKLATHCVPRLPIECHARTRQHHDLAVNKGGPRQRWQFAEIGRASCRERVEMTGEYGTLETRGESWKRQRRGKTI